MTVTRTITAVLNPEAPLLQQYDLPDDDGNIGELLVGASSELLRRLGADGAVTITVTIEAVPTPTAQQIIDDPHVVGDVATAAAELHAQRRDDEPAEVAVTTPAAEPDPDAPTTAGAGPSARTR